MTKKQLIEQMIEEAYRTESDIPWNVRDIPYAKIMSQWLELTRGIDWNQTMGPKI